ncbi:type II toxin-antitoxin system VapC family toxin [Pricia sp. S334]|uniref:Type II toxin-antitoxin system VapC family toxin n=1 Tax=Pricia mediterranea TaxID=3076079 RepID=A0ABU3L347_9FLAO|nr:type II toxin-antitoxin system VapC family toxin [Pricia sp. S334]MDT7827678.1 type II toxin-antitoxin system VapC family toxin [Pricia sp. S334]
MKYLLDTNICVHYFRGQFKLADKIQEVDLRNCAISEITLAELAYGAENSSDPKKNFKLIDKFAEQVKILPIFNAINIYAQEKARLRKKGTMISDFDILIGSTSIANGLIMVTENLKDFERISKIKIENWVKR